MLLYSKYKILNEPFDTFFGAKKILYPLCNSNTFYITLAIWVVYSLRRLIGF